MKRQALTLVASTAIAAVFSLGFAQAQPALDAAKIVAKIGAVRGGSGSGVVKGDTVSPAISNGLNYRHCYAAVWYTNQTTLYVIAYNIEGDQIYAYNTSGDESSMQATLLSVCEAGHAYYAYYNSSSSPYSVYQIQDGF